MESMENLKKVAKMEKKQKIFLVSICIIVAITIIALIVYVIPNNVSENTNENKLAKMYEKMMQNETYSITFTLNDNNKYTISVMGDVANIDTYDDGNHTTNIIKDGNTYLLRHSTKRYYTYQNNVTGLGELSNQINEIIQSQEPEKGQESLDGDNYQYEEYKGISDFLMDIDEDISEEDAITRFYFDGDNLEYIKTIIGDKSELISVNVSYEIDDNIFEIPSDFQKG